MKGPGIVARVRASADQGMRNLAHIAGDDESRVTTFAGAPALALSGEGKQRAYLVASRKRLVEVNVHLSGDDPDATFAAFEKAIAPTFTPRPTKAP